MLTGEHFAKPIKWANLFYGQDQIALSGDLNSDGFADMVVISRGGNSKITVARSMEGQKSLAPEEVISNWGSGLSDACLFKGKLYGLFDGNQNRSISQQSSRSRISAKPTKA